jgi:hypothetical protein
MIDIGGGVGHLARIVAQYYGLESITLDMDKNFQAIGQLRANKYRLPENAKNLTFLNLKFGDHEGNKQLKKLLLNYLKTMEIENKVGLFQGEYDANENRIKWKKIKIDNNNNLIETPC